MSIQPRGKRNLAVCGPGARGPDRNALGEIARDPPVPDGKVHDSPKRPKDFARRRIGQCDFECPGILNAIRALQIREFPAFNRIGPQMRFYVLLVASQSRALTPSAINEHLKIRKKSICRVKNRDAVSAGNVRAVGERCLYLDTRCLGITP